MYGAVKPREIVVHGLLFGAVGRGCGCLAQIAASLLLFLEEEDTFWMMCTIVEDILPASYYSSTLAGVQADQRVLRALVTACLPDLDAVLREHDIGMHMWL